MKRKSLIPITVAFLLLIICLLRAEEMNESDKWVNEILSDEALTKEEIKGTIEKYDLSELFTHTESSFVYGFIGDNYQRIHIHFSKVTKSKSNPSQYEVAGKTRTKNIICDFKGIITMISGRKQANEKIIDRILDRDENIASSIAIRGVIVSDCELRENSDQKYAGVFKGKLTTNFYTDKNNILHYDNLNNYSDNYFNNAFVGVWTSYDGNLIKKVHWGDWRIPYSGDLDVGVGEFWPAKKYINAGLGWDDFKNENYVK